METVKDYPLKNVDSVGGYLETEWIYSDKNKSFNIKNNLIYKHLMKKNYKLLLNKRENYIFKKKL